MRPFHICLHDVTPAFQRQTQTLMHDLAPLVGRQFSCGVVPDWHGAWPLVEHRDYCDLIRDQAAELLLHGCFHRRTHGYGMTSLLTGGSDEMNGLDAVETQRALTHGQAVFTEVFGEPARGFLPPGWQSGHVHAHAATATGRAQNLEFVLGFFSLEASAGHRIPLATWTWDCGRWSWLGHVGHAIGRVLQSMDQRVPVLAIHPADLERGFRPKILRLVQDMIDRGYEPITLAGLLAGKFAASPSDAESDL